MDKLTLFIFFPAFALYKDREIAVFYTISLLPEFRLR
jgi:hypothetical protein